MPPIAPNVEYAIRWGRSELGCSRCGRADALAGWEVTADGKLMGRLCSPCGQEYELGQPLTLAGSPAPGARAGQLEQARLTL